MKDQIPLEEDLAIRGAVRDDWVKIGLDTSPVDSVRILEILNRLYGVAGKPVPEQVVYLNSPLEIATALSKLRKQPGPSESQVSSWVEEEVSNQVLGNYARLVREEFCSQTRGQERFFSLYESFEDRDIALLCLVLG